MSRGANPSGGEEPRPSARQRNVDATRQRIVQAAHDLFGSNGFHGVGLEEVAARAGVGRKTIYYQFGSKLGVLRALIADMSMRGGVADFVSRALAEEDAEQGIRLFITATCALWEEEAAVCRALLAASESDIDVRTATEAANRERRADLRRLAGRAHRAGGLRMAWKPAGAGDALWLLTSFESYDSLRRSGKKPVDAAGLLCELALCLLDR